MFTLKFIGQVDAEGGETERSVSCESYGIYKRSGANVTITIYTKIPSSSGIEFQLSDHIRDYCACFVTNSAGKTIDHYKLPAHGDVSTGTG